MNTNFCWIFLPYIAILFASCSSPSSVSPRQVGQEKTASKQQTSQVDASKIASLEDAILRQVNEYRKQNGADPLINNPKLQNLARSYSQDMSKRAYFSHIDPDGRNPHERLIAAGIKCVTGSENLAKVSRKELVPSEVIDNWIASSIHKQNMLNNRFHETGIGIAWNTEQIFYVTQIFIQNVK